MSGSAHGIARTASRARHRAHGIAFFNGTNQAAIEVNSAVGTFLIRYAPIG